MEPQRAGARPAHSLLIAMGIAAVLTAGCVQTRVIRHKPFFAGLPGVEGDARVIEPGRDASYLEIAETEIRTESDTGKVQLRARNGRHLMIHIYNALMDEERELFTAQVLSQRTKREFLSRGKDPAEAFDMLLAMEDDIVDLFNAMPFGERTPGLVLEPRGDKVQRIRVSALQRTTLKLAGMDMVMENGEYRLVWFVPAGG